MNGRKKTFHVTDVVKDRRDLAYTIQIEEDGVVTWRQGFRFHFNKDVQIYNETIHYMFETILSAPANAEHRGEYELVVDLEHDADILKLRAGYRNLLLADGTGLDSHAVRLLARGCPTMRFVTLADLKRVELEKIDPAEYDTVDSVIMTGENYLRNRYAGNVRLDFTHDSNRLYLLMLLLDHFQAKKILTVDSAKLPVKTFLGRTTDIYTCNFLHGDLGTAFVNARLDPETYFDRLVSCGFYPPYKNFRKYLVAKYLEKKYGFRIFTADRERRFLASNKIDLAGNPDINKSLEPYWRKSKRVGAWLLDDFVLAVNALDVEDLRSKFAHTKDQAAAFDAFVALARDEYGANSSHYDSIRLVDFEKFREAFGDDAEFGDTVLPRLHELFHDDSRHE